MSMQNFPDDTSRGSGMTGQDQSPPGARMKDIASQAGEKLMDTAEQQKRAGADFVTGIADAVRRAASEFDEQVPQAAQYIRSAADQMETVSGALRRRDIGQMLSDVQSFARRQPSAFLGVSFLAGFAVVRFLRSSAPEGSNGNGQAWDNEEPDDNGRYGSPSPGVGGQQNVPPPGSGL